MAHKKNSRKKYNPAKTAKRQMHKCRLYRWENADNTSGHFDAFGPFDAKANRLMMEQAITTKQTWLCVVTAYFLDENDDYYEERLMTSALEPMIIQNEMQMVLDLTQDLVTQAKASGDPAHYQDTCTVLYLYDAALEAQLDNDETTMRLAAKRAELVLQRKQKVLG